MKKVKVFYGYAEKDRELREELSENLRTNPYIEELLDYKILPGSRVEEEIDKYLNDAQIILLLISTNFINSDFYISKALSGAIQRHEENKTYIIPIILRPVYLEDTPFKNLKVLPADKRAVTLWKEHREFAFFEIAGEIRRVVKDILKKEYLSEAVQYQEKRQYAQARTNYKEAARFSSEEDFTLYQSSGEMSLLLDDLPAALEDYDKALSLSPSNAELYEVKGDILVKSGRLGDALDTYKKLVRLKGDNSEVLTRIGDIYARMKFPREALAAYQSALSNTKDDASLYKRIADIHMQQKDYSKALLAYDKVIDIDPRDSDVYRRRGQVYLNLSYSLKSVLDQYNLALMYDKENVEIYIDKGNILFNHSEFEKALEIYNIALKLKGASKNMKLWRDRGITLFELENYEESIMSYEKAIELEPGNTYLHQELGDIYLHVGRIVEALTAYEQAIDANDKSVTAYESKARALRALAKQIVERLERLAEEALQKSRELDR